MSYPDLAAEVHRITGKDDIIVSGITFMRTVQNDLERRMRCRQQFNRVKVLDSAFTTDTDDDNVSVYPWPPASDDVMEILSIVGKDSTTHYRHLSREGIFDSCTRDKAYHFAGTMGTQDGDLIEVRNRGDEAVWIEYRAGFPELTKASKDHWVFTQYWDIVLLASLLNVYTMHGMGTEASVAGETLALRIHEINRRDAAARNLNRTINIRSPQ